MPILDDATRLRIFISEDDTHEGRPLYEVILAAAREARLAGAIVLRGIAGFGRSAHIHEVFRGFSYDLPIVVEMVDTDERINAWLPILDGLLSGGLVTVEKVSTLHRT